MWRCPSTSLFTKADRIPHFEDWAAPFTSEEIRAPLGAALPFDNADAQTGAARSTRGRRVRRARHAATRRRDGRHHRGARRRAVAHLLGRESVGERRLTAYELPREMGKLSAPVSRFLVELCRPMHLGVSPQLRGFYFVGARPVLVSGCGATGCREARCPLPTGAPDATRVFASLGVAAAQAAPAYTPPASRRVPQWVFLDRLFPEVILADRGAATAASGGLRVAHVRRTLLGRWHCGRARGRGRRDSLVAGQSVAGEPCDDGRRGRGGASGRSVTGRSGDLPVRRRAESSRRASSDARYARRAIAPTACRRASAGDCGAVTRCSPVAAAFGSTAIVANCTRPRGARSWIRCVRCPSRRGLTDDYGRDYAMLKAYLVMTNESPRSTPKFLAPVLLTSWARGQSLDADMTALARRQFEFYAAELARANPWPQAADGGIVRHSRDFLRRFSGADQIYQSMLAQANQAAPPAKLAEVAPTAAGVIAAPNEMPGAFTAAGWTQMENAFRNADPYFEGERWVVGDSAAAQTQDREAVLAELRRRYRGEYVQRWRTYVRGTSVVRVHIGARCRAEARDSRWRAVAAARDARARRAQHGGRLGHGGGVPARARRHAAGASRQVRVGREPAVRQRAGGRAGGDRAGEQHAARRGHGERAGDGAGRAAGVRPRDPGESCRAPARAEVRGRHRCRAGRFSGGGAASRSDRWRRSRAAHDRRHASSSCDEAAGRRRRWRSRAAATAPAASWRWGRATRRHPQRARTSAVRRDDADAREVSVQSRRARPKHRSPTSPRCWRREPVHYGRSIRNASSR